MRQEWVIDPSVLVQGYIEDSETLRVYTLLNTAADPDVAVLHAPEFCLLECTNILWKRVRLHGTSPEMAHQALTKLLALPLTLHPMAALLRRALTIGLNFQLAVYDSLYIALAEATKFPLLTVDNRQANAPIP